MRRMSDVEARIAAIAARTPTQRREAYAGFAILVAILLALTLAAYGLLYRTSGEPLVLSVLAVLASFGVFFLFAAAGGVIRFGAGARPDQVLEDYLTAESEGLQIRDPSGAVVYVNRAFGGLLGIDDEAALGVEHALTRDVEAGEVGFRLLRAAENGYGWEEEVELHRVLADGAIERRALRISVAHFQAPAANGANQRMTAWRVSPVLAIRPTSNEIAPAASLADFADELPVGLLSIDADGETARPNRVLGSWLGYLPAGDGRLPELPFPAEAKATIEQARQSAASGEVTAVTLTLPASDGEPRAFDLFVNASATGVTGGSEWLAVHRPAAAIEPTEDPEIADARFARLFHSAPIAIATAGADGRIFNANAAFDRLWGDSAGKRGRAGNLLRRLGDTAGSELRTALERAIVANEDSGPLELALGDGAERTLQLFISAERGGGDNARAIVFAIDTTKQKELEQQFAQSHKMQAVGQFAGGIAHDFNNVLTVIIGSSDLLLANLRPNDPAFNDITAIKQSANRAAGMVRQLLAFSRRQTLRPAVLSLTEVISDLSTFLTRTVREKIKLRVSPSRDLWDIKADLTQLQQVILNLAVNAADAMPDGGKLTIRTSNVSIDESQRVADKGIEPGDYVLLEVVDTGTGMAPEIKEKIFEPYFTTKDVGKGTGLGLSVVYGIVKQTGGYIYCDSTPGKGTAFRIYLPRHIGKQADVEVETRSEREAVERKDRSRDLTGTGTVLLVEDEEPVRRLASRALERQGYRVIEAGSGTEALAQMAAVDGKVDIVVSDIVMPEMDGPTLLKELRQRNPGISIIFISGYAEDALKSLTDGEEFSFLAKPFQLKDLVSAVKEVIER